MTETLHLCGPLPRLYCQVRSRAAANCGVYKRRECSCLFVVPHTYTGLTEIWKDGHNLHQQVCHLLNQLGRLSSSRDNLWAEQLSLLSVLTPCKYSR